MTAAQPTILATSAGYLPHPRLRFRFGPMIDLALELAGEVAPPVVGLHHRCGPRTPPDLQHLHRERR